METYEVMTFPGTGKTCGSVVRHDVTGETGLVIGETPNRLWVSTRPGEYAIWYRASVTEI